MTGQPVRLFGGGTRLARGGQRSHEHGSREVQPIRIVLVRCEDRDGLGRFAGRQEYLGLQHTLHGGVGRIGRDQWMAFDAFEQPLSQRDVSGVSRHPAGGGLLEQQMPLFHGARLAETCRQVFGPLAQVIRETLVGRVTAQRQRNQ